MKKLLLLAFIGGACLLNACGGSGGGRQSGVATHFAVTAPAAVSIGELFNLTVTALDAANNVATGYSGIVLLSSTDPGFPLQGNNALVSGMGTFSVGLETAGSQTITATDNANSRVSGTSNPISVKLGVVRLEVDATSFASTGTSFDFKVTALDGLYHTFPDYSGTVSFTSTDGQAVLPADSPLTSGTGTFSITFKTPGNQTITATDTVTTAVTGHSTSIQVSAPAVGFTPTGRMADGRAGHTATLLNDGNVLVAGGLDWACPPVGPCNGFVLLVVGFAETYDTPGGIFNSPQSPPSRMNVPRVFHTATLLQDGKVLVAGGDDRYTTTYDTAEIFDPSTGTFTPTANMLSARSGHTATLLANGKVLLASGYAGNGNWPATAELFDPSSGTFTATGSMSVARPWDTATLLQDGRVLFAGGKSGSPHASTATAEIYDPATGIFTATGSMNIARSEHTATLLANGKVLVAGGVDASGMITSTAEIFDELTGVFTPTGNMITARSGQTETLLTDGKVLLTGGFDANKHDLSSAEWFSSSNGTFSVAGNMEIQRSNHTATLLKNGDVLITGGNNQDGVVPVRTLATAELFP
jgi:hypothetical protein